MYFKDMITDRSQTTICPGCVSIELRTGAVRWRLQDLAFP
jgi:hypothetical protein